MECKRVRARSAFVPTTLCTWALPPNRTSRRRQRHTSASMHLITSRAVESASETESHDAAACVARFDPEPFIPFGLRNPHSQTIFGAFYPPTPRLFLRLKHEILPTDDGLDSIHVDITNGLKLGPEQGSNCRPVALVIHGLEAGGKTGLSCRIALALVEQGFKVVLFNFRSCAEEAPIPTTAKTYHAGFYDDVVTVLKRMTGQDIYLVGYSLGSNVLINLLGKLEPSALTSLGVVAAAGFSVPFDPTACQIKLDSGLTGLIYSRRFVRSLKAKILSIVQAGVKLPDAVDMNQLMKARTVGEFDDYYVAKVYGFENRLDYYRQVDPRQYMHKITVPSYFLSSRDDPFFDHADGASLPSVEDLGDAPVKICVTEHGGHCGFVDVDGVSRRRPTYAAREMARFCLHVHASRSCHRTEGEASEFCPKLARNAN